VFTAGQARIRRNRTDWHPRLHPHNRPRYSGHSMLGRYKRWFAAAPHTIRSSDGLAPS
jgi:hypothetical protein